MTERSDTPNADEFLDTLFSVPDQIPPEAYITPKPIPTTTPSHKNSFERMAYVVGGILTLCVMTCIVSAAVWATTWFVYLLWGSR